LSKTIKIALYKTLVKPAVVYGSGRYGYETTEYIGEENGKDIWIGGRTSNMENKN